MKRPYTTALLAAVGVAIAAPALAQEDPIALLAQKSGLREREVRMLVGGRTAFAEYRTTYDRCEEKLIKAIGEENYQRLLDGKPIALQQKEQSVVESAVAATGGDDDD